ncbi:toxin-antitoxin system YwqK family antitoxin [Flammeovirga sp. MY04]|uniref:toxin-antitoxin system YwqK family antitoxin n=1 Tax=Flammeovirga sp. MY04 TaxID=1191459 RepID=UPI0013053F18|nr:toxin-antitoxin system YwqK family antitoxin [Flammeovirga sp. MY04]ANQ48010.2 toxin-antitoxin system YwqK family antitoxin [Flammeovirga sp. MY04]
MARQVLLQISFFLCLFQSSCNSASENKTATLARINHMILADDHQIVLKGGNCYVDGKLYSGQIYWVYPNTTDTLKVRSYHQGKKDGEWRKFYPQNTIKEKRYFINGKKEGVHIGYYHNHKTQFLYHLENDLYHGNCKAWNFDGQLIRDQNYVNGQEEGSQKIWYDNGKIKANYVKKDGRRFGLLGTKNCINVYDEKF